MLIDTESFAASTAIADFVNYGLMGSVGNGASITTGGPFGDNVLNVAATTVFTQGTATMRPMPIAAAAFFAGARINPNVCPGFAIQYLSPVGAVQFSIVFNSTGSFSVYRGAQTTVLGTSGAGLFPPSAVSYFEVGGVVAAGTGGSVVIRVNGVTVYTLSGVNNQGDATNVGVSQVRFTSTTSTPGGNAAQIQHTYFCDNTGSAPWNTFLGDVRVQALFPTSDASVAFTPNGLADNYLNAAKVPPVPATDFNASSTAGATDLFNTGTISTAATNILGVHAKALMSKSDAGTRTAATIVKSGGTIATGGTIGLGTAPVYVHGIFQTDPATSAQWTSSGVNAATKGYEIIA